MSECPLLTYMHKVEAWCYNSIGLYTLTIDFLEMDSRDSKTHRQPVGRPLQTGQIPMLGNGTHLF